MDITEAEDYEVLLHFHWSAINLFGDDLGEGFSTVSLCSNRMSNM